MYLLAWRGDDGREIAQGMVISEIRLLLGFGHKA